MAKDKMKNMSTRKKASRLFWGSLAPLLTVTIVACTFFYNVSDKILKYYMDAELTKSVERVNANMLEKMSPVMINVENFTNIVSITDDKEVIQFLVEKFAENLGTASSIYYTTVENWERGNGYFIESSGWMPSSGFDPATREWYKNAVANKGEVQFSSPYVDVQTNKIAVTISQAVTDTNGKIKGVVGCDMILDDLVALLREIKISKTATMEVITDNGLYMTSEDQSKIMNVNYFTVSDFPGSKAEWLDGTTRTLVNSKKYYAITKVGPAPWFIVAEGSVQDFKGTLANIIIIFEIALVIFSIFCSVMNIRTIQKMRKGEQELGAKLFEETQTLVVAAKENAATSQDQSAAVKEIVATMEDSNALSESIASKIRDVSHVAEKTSSDVADGVASIEENVNQLHAIFDANQQTIDGMKVLSDKIESIWDIVTLINNVADQAKIIAFNAELEASSAGEAGKSFRIVANEIRRLSDGIIDGTKEIKEKITEIQHSSDSLILASESGTEKINAGYENAKSLGERFASIKDSAEITASSAGDITDIIQQQSNSSEQILIALKQISAGVENFAVATDNISSSSEHIRKMSEELNNTVKSSEEEMNEEKAKAKAKKGK